MNYLSVCSGVEAATVAWHPLGWNPVAFSEIEKFPSQVLAHHYPAVPNMGDMTKYKEWNLGAINLLVGGTPCQSFSVAGLRKGMDDPRGNLALVYCGILDHYRPQWFVWENVPGVLSSNGGQDFGAFLGALGELGYGFSYRVLDAQYWGVAQRRRRVFVVGHLGDWRPTAAVLFEPKGLSRDIKPSRGEGQEAAKCLTTRVRNDYETESFIYENHPSDSRVKEMGDVCQTITSSWGTGGGNIPFVQNVMKIRRLTPTECERLQGFPDGYTDIRLNNKKTPDGSRYKAMGNSMAVPVMRWIGERIDKVNKLL